MFFFQRKPKKVLVTIHGFGKRAHHEFDDLYVALKNDDYDIVLFDYFDPKDEQDVDYETWVQRCEDKVKEYIREYDQISILGFSMGGVIASYLSTIFPIEKLILVAPAFQYLNASKLVEYGLKGLRAFTNQESIPKNLPSSQHVYAFTEVVAQYKESITQVDCPVLFLHGTNDEVIPVSSSKDAYQKAKGEKLLLLVEGGKHRMLYDGTFQEQLYPILQLMMDDKLFNNKGSL